MIEALRGLLLGTPVGNDAWYAIAWFGSILLVGMAVSIHLFARGGR